MHTSRMKSRITLVLFAIATAALAAAFVLKSAVGVRSGR